MTKRSESEALFRRLYMSTADPVWVRAYIRAAERMRREIYSPYVRDRESAQRAYDRAKGRLLDAEAK
jgi:hypothetical protein